MRKSPASAGKYNDSEQSIHGFDGKDASITWGPVPVAQVADGSSMAATLRHSIKFIRASKDLGLWVSRVVGA
jgi:hypothetical protein